MTKIKQKGKPYLKVFIQIFLLVSISFAYSYLTHELDKNLVSAQDDIDVNEIVHTCVENANTGEICQEHLAEDCADICGTDCVSSTMDNIVDCELGTCFDPVNGFCFPNSPRKKCENNGGEFFEDGNSLECELGCCVIGNAAEMRTKVECDRIGINSGKSVEFKPELSSGECYLLNINQVLGACIMNAGTGDDLCRLKTQTVCEAESGLFYSGILCSHPALHMDYEKTHHTGCVPGRDEIYWFDDQGNRENIYEGSSDTQKESSWNNGKVKSKADSCDLGDSLENQGTCGNCDRLTSSSVCGEKTDAEKLIDDEQDVVCKSMYCYDEANDKIRENGETWCFYEGNILPTKERATVTPGSRHFIMQCLDGEISISRNCADYRDTICMEEQTEKEDGTLRSVASCQANNFYDCLLYNKEKNLGECSSNPLCFVKKINLPDYDPGDDEDDTDFKFNVCVPKYPGGTGGDFEDYEYVCEVADLKCPMAKVKKIDFGGTYYEWSNRGCTRTEFVEQMNDLCISLGDCGASVNYVGIYSENFKVSGGPSGQKRKLPDSYINAIKKYDNTIIGDFIQFETALFDIQKGQKDPFGDAQKLDKSFPPEPEALQIIGLDIPFLGPIMNNPKIWGISGILSTLGVWKLGTWIASKLGASSFGANFATYAFPVMTAIAGASLVSWLMGNLKIGAGLDDTVASILVTAGGVSGFLIGLQTIAPQAWSPTCVGAIAVYVLIAIVVIEYLLESWGVGKTTKYKVSFDCEPWTPPQGGEDCHECTDSDLPCTDYACWSLGTTCQLINENTFREECAHVPTAPGGPVISPLYSAKLPETDYVNAQAGVGYEIENLQSEDGCFLENDLVMIGLNLSEAGRCTYSITEGIIDWLDASGFLEYLAESQGLTEVTTSDIIGELIENKDIFYFGGNNMYLYEHVQPITLPGFSAISTEQVFAPEKETDFEMIINCEDLEGEKSSTDYRVRFCLKSGNRTVPPHVLGHLPRNGLLTNDVEELNFTVYTNAPSECKWDISDEEYDEMAYDFECKNNPETDVIPLIDLGISANGFECTSNTSMGGATNKTIYVRCKDQPWYAEDDPARNTMLSSYPIELTRTNALEITSLSPSGGTLRFGIEPAEVVLEIDTAGGADDGEATCYYLAGGDYDTLWTTGDTHHRHTFDQYTGGKYKMYVYCEDSIGNIARKESEEFTIEIDNDAPEVVRAYEDRGMLKVETNEPATCYFGHRSCSFDLENGTLMTVGLSTTHSTNWENGKSYYIRCMDGWENYESGCSQIIKSWSF